MSMKAAFTILNELEAIYFDLYLEKVQLTKDESATIPARPRCKTMTEVCEQIEYQITWINKLEEEISYYRVPIDSGQRPGRVARERDATTFEAILQIVNTFKNTRPQYTSLPDFTKDTPDVVSNILSAYPGRARRIR